MELEQNWNWNILEFYWNGIYQNFMGMEWNEMGWDGIENLKWNKMKWNWNWNILKFYWKGMGCIGLEWSWNRIGIGMYQNFIGMGWDGVEMEQNEMDWN